MHKGNKSFVHYPQTKVVFKKNIYIYFPNYECVCKVNQSDNIQGYGCYLLTSSGYKETAVLDTLNPL